MTTVNEVRMQQLQAELQMERELTAQKYNRYERVFLAALTGAVGRFSSVDIALAAAQQAAEEGTKHLNVKNMAIAKAVYERVRRDDVEKDDE